MPYKIVRHFEKDKGTELVIAGLSYLEALRQVNLPESNSDTCLSLKGKALFLERGPWLNIASKE